MDGNLNPVDTTHQSRVAMRRIQFIELHDQPWFPSFLRDYVTDALQFGFNLVKAYAPVALLLQGVLDSTESRSIVDLCSGAGGPWFDLSRKLQSRTRQGETLGLQIWLTDKYPNPGASQMVGAAGENRISFYAGSVDAVDVPAELKGLRTMFTSFHHFPPAEARAILQNAVDSGESIGIFEVPRRALSTIALTFAFILMLFVGAPWIRPFRWSRLFWTYLVPIIPLVLLFDGVVSCLRTYRPQELREMVGELTANEYQWEIGDHSGASGRLVITYLIGVSGGSWNEKSGSGAV
jgi:hypothetical protein